VSAVAQPDPGSGDRGLDIRNESVASIVRQWNRELTSDVKDFEEQSQRVAAWEQQLRENTKNVNELTEYIRKLRVYQEELKDNCDQIERYQDDLQGDLAFVSGDISAYLEELDGQEVTEDDIERENMYTLAENLDQHLQVMENNIRKIVSDFNAARGGSPEDMSVFEGTAGDGSNPLAKVIQILNAHHNNLTWLDSKSRQLKRDISALNDSVATRM